MSLAQCRECGKEVSTEAASCPHCGAPNPYIPRPSAPLGGVAQGLPVFKKPMPVVRDVFKNPVPPKVDERSKKKPGPGVALGTSAVMTAIVGSLTLGLGVLGIGLLALWDKERVERKKAERQKQRDEYLRLHGVPMPEPLKISPRTALMVILGSLVAFPLVISGYLRSYPPLTTTPAGTVSQRISPTPPLSATAHQAAAIEAAKARFDEAVQRYQEAKALHDKQPVDLSSENSTYNVTRRAYLKAESEMRAAQVQWEAVTASPVANITPTPSVSPESSPSSSSSSTSTSGATEAERRFNICVGKTFDPWRCYKQEEAREERIKEMAETIRRSRGR